MSVSKPCKNFKVSRLRRTTGTTGMAKGIVAY